MMESCIKQNNGIDIYIEYFEDVDEGTESEAPQTKTVGIMRPTQFIWLKKVCQDSIAILSRLTATSGQCQISHSKWTDKSKFKFRDCAPITKNYVVPRIVIAYCNLEFQAITEETPKPSYVFNLGKHREEKYLCTNSLPEDPTTASLELGCPHHLVSCEYNPKENSLLAGGCYNGQVCYWDDRSGPIDNQDFK